jgi:hypothetical protein
MSSSLFLICYKGREEIMELKTLGTALDNLSWQRIQDIYPVLAEAIRSEVDAGRTPEQIRRYVMRHSGHTGLADWCQASARACVAENSTVAD